jgi:C1A family cysteine protease
MMRGMGWRKDLTDPRDYTHGEVPAANAAVEAAQAAAAMNFSRFAPPIKDQEDLGSCTAHGVAGAFEFDGIKNGRGYLPISRLFLYKAARRYGGFQGDSGAMIRDAIRALVRLGSPPEDIWPYRVADFDRDPDFVAAGEAQNFQALRYVRLKDLTEIKAYIRAGFPVVFGFTVFQSIDLVQDDGWVPFIQPQDKPVGGHCVYTCRYDNFKASPHWKDAPGAIGFANSWGTTWGDQGWGWLPYRYFAEGLCDDFWALISAEHPSEAEFEAQRLR